MIITNDAVIQFVKYALAGGVAVITHICIFHLVAWKFFPCLQPKDHAVKLFHLQITDVSDATRSRNSMIGNAIAFLVSNLVAYVLNILWVFERGRHHFIVEIVLFYLVSGVSALIGTALMGYLIKRFGILTTYAFCTNIFTAVMINYAVRKFFIFHG